MAFRLVMTVISIIFTVGIVSAIIGTNNIIIILSFTVFQGAFTFVYITVLSSVGERVATRMRKQLFENIITQDIAFFDSHKTGEIINR